MHEPVNVMAGTRTAAPGTGGSPASLVTAALRGDRRAAEALWERQASRLIRAAIALGIPPDDAPDVTQETLVAGFRGLRRFDPGRASLETWLHTILIRRCANWRRGRRRWLHALRGVAAAPSPQRSGSEEILDARRTLEHLLQDLAPVRRRAWVLVEVSGLSQGDAAAVLGVKESTIRSHLRHAREAMRRRGEETP